VSTRKTRPFGYTGSSFDSFLEEEGILDEVESAAIKRVIVWQSAEGQKQILRLTTPKLHPKEPRPLFGDPGTEKRLGSRSLRMTGHLMLWTLETGYLRMFG
jgi:hypothetical protein